MSDPESLPTEPKAPEQDRAAAAQASAETSARSAGPVYSGQPDDLHDLFAVNAPQGTDEEDPLAALRNDPNYSALIRDLEYIAKQARLLFEPAQESPSDQVWDKIQSQLGTRPPDA